MFSTPVPHKKRAASLEQLLLTFVAMPAVVAAAGLSAALMQVKAEVSAPNDESDSTIVVEGPPAAPIETIDLAEGSSDSGSDHEAARAREARRLRRRHRRPTNTDAATNSVVDRSERSSRPVHARTVETASCSIWPTGSMSASCAFLESVPATPRMGASRHTATNPGTARA